jgi:hypothetical protein
VYTQAVCEFIRRLIHAIINLIARVEMRGLENLPGAGAKACPLRGFVALHSGAYPVDPVRELARRAEKYTRHHPPTGAFGEESTRHLRIESPKGIQSYDQAYSRSTAE